MHAPTRLLLLLVLSSACNRSEEPESSRGAQSASSPKPPAAPEVAAAPRPEPPSKAPSPAPVADGGAAAGSASPVASASASAEPRCVVPLGESAPAAQKPAQHCPKDTGTPPKLQRRALRFPEATASPKLTVELARSPHEHERGLMFRTRMAENQGMLFEWPSEARRVFWMRNTCIPLDMLFIAKDGTVAGIQEQVPTLNEAPRTVACPAAYVLEVNAGWCRRHGVKPGMQMKLE